VVRLVLRPEVSQSRAALVGSVVLVDVVAVWLGLARAVVEVSLSSTDWTISGVLGVEVVLGDTTDDEVEVVVLLVDAEVLVVFFD